MGGCSKLSHVLLDSGFFSVLGTSERHGHMGMAPGEEELRVKRGERFTFDSNNGVMVVYDEEYRPWICRINCAKDGNLMESLVRVFLLKRGAYVPHSNDGGYFVREVLSKL